MKIEGRAVVNEPKPNVGYRVFIVDGDDLIPVSQKKFKAFYFEKQPVLPELAGRTLALTMAVYTLRGRKPNTICRLSCQHVRIGPDGAVDEAYELRGIRLMAYQMSNERRAVSGPGNVVDAEAPFAQREWESRHPDLSGPVQKKILAILFGRR